MTKASVLYAIGIGFLIGGWAVFIPGLVTQITLLTFIACVMFLISLIFQALAYVTKKREIQPLLGVYKP